MLNLRRLVSLFIFLALLFFLDSILSTSLASAVYFSAAFSLYLFGSSILILVFTLFALVTQYYRKDPYQLFFYAFGGFVLVFVPKLFLVAFTGFNSILSALLPSEFYPLPLFSYVGLLCFMVLFLAILDGIIWGRFRFTVRKNDVLSSKVPKSFDGFKIVQISDIHLGSFFDNHKAFEKGIRKINALNPDLVLFTGDLVNNYASETTGWLEILKTIKANYGIYAILGNHDYADYVSFERAEHKHQNRADLLAFFKKLNWHLLLNDSAKVELNKEFIQLLGVENWGLPPFPQYGSLNRAMRQTDKSAFTILLSHDPSHWEAEVLSFPHIDLTLSGHTHGMQFGIEFGTFKWSPVKWKYPKWAGAYFSNQQQLYVNRGFGYIGFPGRIGIWPEITLHRLRKD